MTGVTRVVCVPTVFAASDLLMYEMIFLLCVLRLCFLKFESTVACLNSFSFLERNSLRMSEIAFRSGFISGFEFSRRRETVTRTLRASFVGKTCSICSLSLSESLLPTIELWVSAAGDEISFLMVDNQFSRVLRSG